MARAAEYTEAKKRKYRLHSRNSKRHATGVNRRKFFHLRQCTIQLGRQGLALIAHPVVLDVLATSRALQGFAVIALVIIADVFANGVNVAAGHQHHCED